MNPIHKVQNKSEFVREHRRGDLRSDGCVFESYRYIGDKVYERWCSPSQLDERRRLSSQAAAKWAKRPENKARVSAAIGASNKRIRKIRPARFLLSAAKARAKKLGVPFDLTVNDIVVPDVCPVLGMKLVIGEGACSDASPSVDRIIPSLGYTKGNVAVISRRANRIKNDATPEELERVLNYARQQF